LDFAARAHNASAKTSVQTPGVSPGDRQDRACDGVVVLPGHFVNHGGNLGVILKPRLREASGATLPVLSRTPRCPLALFQPDPVRNRPSRFRIDIESAATPLDATNGFRDGKQSCVGSRPLKARSRDDAASHVEVMSFNLNRRGVLQDPRSLAISYAAVAIAQCPEPKSASKEAAKQASFAGFVVKMRHSPEPSSAARLRAGRRIPLRAITPCRASEWRDQRRRDRLPDPIAQNDVRRKAPATACRRRGCQGRRAAADTARCSSINGRVAQKG